MNHMAKNFEEGFCEVMRSVAANATELKASAEGMTASAMEMREKTETF